MGDPVRLKIEPEAGPEEYLTVHGVKKWIDNGNAAGKRPAAITIRLYADGSEQASRTVTEADGWEWRFTGLPKYANGKEIVYTITEDAVDHYISVVSGYDVTNMYSESSEHIPEGPEGPKGPETGTPESSILGARLGRGRSAQTIPDTGDDSSAGIWLAMMLAGFLGLGINGLMKRRRRKG